MEQTPEGQEPQKTPEEIIAALTAELNDLKPKAEASSQNFERLKKAEKELEELKPKLVEKGESSVDFDALANLVSATKDLAREELSELTSEAKSLGIDPMKYLSSKAGQAHLGEIRRASKSLNANPASSGIKTFNGKPVDEIFKSGSPAEKQAAFQARMHGGVKSE